MDHDAAHTPSPQAAARPRRPHVKICGLSSEAMIDAALARGADEVGLVHFPASPRHARLPLIARLRSHVAGRALVTVVTVDPDDEFLLRLRDEARPDAVQLHGSETPERVAAVRALTGLSVMKAISVAGADDIAKVAAYREADRILLDAKAPKGAALPGGNGIAFDWRLLQGLGGPFILSGGLNAANIGEAVRIAQPAGVDVSSGVESAPGVKDATLIHRFFDALDAATSSDLQRRAS